MKISLILPYWDRQEAANKAFELLVKQYSDLDLEIVVVDDGNPVPFRRPQLPLDIKIVTLPLKHAPKCPATVWNAGVNAASGDIVILSCIEILHEKPIIKGMQAELEGLGEKGYILAAAWCPEENKWHCHSTIKTPRNPWGTGIAFCGMMYKDMFWKAGGFDEEYREGAGYEDNDFINRMLIAGAKFKIMDNLVVTHPKSGAITKWPEGGFARNEALFHKKWPETPYPKKLKFVCVNWGNYCGRGIDYVNRLFDAVVGCLPGGTQFRFVCFSDNKATDGLREEIEVEPLPEGIQGWWSKLYLFKEGLFQENEKIIFFDLDTIIVRSLEDIIGYEGQFAILRDFYFPERLAPAIMVWQGGFCTDIWESYEKAGYPTDLPLGDLSWINQHFEKIGYKADILQDLFPDKFCSYKRDAQDGIPKKSAVICFHGHPRPHEAGGWVKEVWERGKREFEKFIVSNSTSEIIAKNIKSSCELAFPRLKILSQNNNDAIIVGGAPSLKDNLEYLRLRKQNGNFVISTNGTHDYLIDNGIIPDAEIIIDSRPENAKFVENPRKDIAYYIASSCAPEIFNALEGMNVTILHLGILNIGDYLPPKEDGNILLFGGSTVGLIAISLAHTLGYRRFHLFGMDSSYRESTHHAYEQKLNSNENTLEINLNDRKFIAAPWMIAQTHEFIEFSQVLIEEGCEIQVVGDGLLPYAAHCLLT